MRLLNNKLKTIQTRVVTGKTILVFIHVLQRVSLSNSLNIYICIFILNTCIYMSLFFGGGGAFFGVTNWNLTTRGKTQIALDYMYSVYRAW